MSQIRFDLNGEHSIDEIVDSIVKSLPTEIVDRVIERLAARRGFEMKASNATGEFDDCCFG